MGGYGWWGPGVGRWGIGVVGVRGEGGLGVVGGQGLRV